MHLEEVQRPPKDASERLLIKKKTIRVLLDTVLSGDLLFLEKYLISAYQFLKGLFYGHGASPMAPLNKNGG
jgi:hypothetical protein